VIRKYSIVNKQYLVSGPSGFTLLELMLSLTILGVVLLIIFGALRIGTRAWEKGEKDIDIMQRQRAVADLMVQQIAGACIYELKMGEESFYFKGSETEMAFVSRSPIVPGSLTGVVFVKYMILPAEEEGKLRLMLYEKDAAYMKAETLETQKLEDFFSLLSDIQSLQFEYLKETEDEAGTAWQAFWNPPEDEGMPLAVRISMQKDGDAAPVYLIIPIRCRKE